MEKETSKISGKLDVLLGIFQKIGEQKGKRMIMQNDSIQKKNSTYQDQRFVRCIRLLHCEDFYDILHSTELIDDFPIISRGLIDNIFEIKIIS